MKIVNYFNKLKTLTQIPIYLLCQMVPVGYTSFMRWKQRNKLSKPCYIKPGPKKVEAFNQQIVMRDILKIDHCKKRSLGTGKLIQKYNNQSSRRNIQSLVKEVRTEINNQKKIKTKKINWISSGTVWSLDDTFCYKTEAGKLYLNNISDLGSRYRIAAQFNYGGVLSGEQIAIQLDSLFKKYGAPLILKRDNGSNLNHSLINDILEKHQVISLNSPVNYPKYNGSIEYTQREIKSKMEKCKEKELTILNGYGTSICQTLNHTPRKVLSGKIACEVFAQRTGGKNYSKRKRKEIFNWIKKLTLIIVSSMKKVTNLTLIYAWRKAVETWLQHSNHIQLIQNGKVLPCLFLKSFHN